MTEFSFLGVLPLLIEAVRDPTLLSTEVPRFSLKRLADGT